MQAIPFQDVKVGQKFRLIFEADHIEWIRIENVYKSIPECHFNAVMIRCGHSISINGEYSAVGYAQYISPMAMVYLID